MLVTSQFPIQTTKIFFIFWISICVPHFEKRSVTHVWISAARVCKKHLWANYAGCIEEAYFLVTVTQTESKPLAQGFPNFPRPCTPSEFR